MADTTSKLRRIAQRLARQDRADRALVRSAEPAVVAIDDVAESVRLTIRDLPPGTAQLVLAGRKSGLEKATVLSEKPDASGTRCAHLEPDDLTAFAAETIDLFTTVQDDQDDEERRRRLSSGDLQLLHPQGTHRWYTTAEGNVSVRRATPAEIIRESATFDADHYRRQVPELATGIDPIDHYVAVGAADGLNPSAMFDTTYYRRNNPSIRRQNPLAHYCEEGWRELRNPSPDFDTWWYWYKHLDPTDESINPLAHYLSEGKQRGLSTRPQSFPSRSLGAGHELDAGAPPRRICLFAGYDLDGLIDQYVVDYVRELARHADVYYLADCALPESELAKLRPFTQEAWAERHGHYDFGSYARMIERIGWAEIECYDELLLVNDSCYLLRPLDSVFARMDGQACDWWGLQATKGLRQTRNEPRNQFREPIDMPTVRGSLVDGFERDYTYDFLIGSYFLAFRRPVVTDSEFRRYVTSVTSHERKRDIVKKYEVGLTRWLIQHGHAFDTFVSKLYPFHPIFTMWYFRLLDEGFPLLKRYFLAENHYGVPRLWRWRDLVAERIPDAPIGLIEQNLVRVTESEKLQRSLTIGAAPEAVDAPVPADLLTPADFQAADVIAPKYADWWVFATDESSGLLTGNVRAVFEAVREDRSVHKIILTRHERLEVEGADVEIVRLDTPLAQHRLLRAGTILLSGDADTSLVHPVSSALHNLVLLGDEVAVARWGYAATQSRASLDRVARENARFRAVISSSKLDSLARAAASYPLTIHQVWTTGLPRHDFITCAEQELPTDLKADLDRLRQMLDSRFLVTYIPARRAAAVGRFDDVLLGDRVAAWLRENDAVLGIRTDWAGTTLSQLPPELVLDLSPTSFAHIEVVHRLASAMITDYGSAFVDFLLTGRPLLSYAPDLDSSLFAAGGALLDFEAVFPGRVCRTVDEFHDTLPGLLGSGTDPAYESKRRLFFDHLDAHSSARVVERIRELVTVHGIGTWSGERIA